MSHYSIYAVCSLAANSMPCYIYVGKSFVSRLEETKFTATLATTPEVEGLREAVNNHWTGLLEWEYW